MHMVQEENHMGYQEEITNRSVLAEALLEHEAQMYAYSKGRRGLEPAIGKKHQFETEQKKCDILRKMIRALESEPVRVAIARWQQEEMGGEKQRELFSPEMAVVFRQGDKDGYTDENRAGDPEGRGVSGGENPVFAAAEMEPVTVGRVADEEPGKRAEGGRESGRPAGAV